MGTIPFQMPGMPRVNQNTMPTGAFGTNDRNMPMPFDGGAFNFGDLPFNFSPFGGGDNGLNMAGAWASGGFNTTGQPSQSGFNSFFGTGTNTPNNSSTLFGLPQNTFPAFGTSNVSGGIPFSGSPNTSPGANNQFGFNPNTGLPTIGGPGIGVQPGSQGPFPQIDTDQLKKMFGNGIGGALTQFLNSGAGFNPQVIQALINQALPLEAKGSSRLMQQFGSTGNAYSSTAAIGLGDFEAQFDANLTAQIAQVYEQSVQNYINILENMLPGAQKGQAEKLTPTSLISAGVSALGAFGTSL